MCRRKSRQKTFFGDWGGEGGGRREEIKVAEKLKLSKGTFKHVKFQPFQPSSSIWKGEMRETSQKIIKIDQKTTFLEL